MLWICKDCTASYAVGAEKCPQCGSTEYHEEGSEEQLAGEAALDIDEVPDGAANEVLAWVGDDSERAVLALTVEQAKEKPRSTLVDQLAKLAGQGAK